MRVPRANAGSSPVSVSSAATRSPADARGTTRWAASTSAIVAPIRIRGSRLLSGSWNTICASRRYALSAARSVPRHPARPRQCCPPDGRTSRRQPARSSTCPIRSRPQAPARTAPPGHPVTRRPQPAPARTCTARSEMASSGTGPVTAIGGFGAMGSGVPGQSVPPAATERRHRLDQLGGVRVGGRGQDLAAGPGLDDQPAAHDRHPVAQLGDDGQVVADEQDGHADGLAQLTEQVEHLGLDRHIQGAGRLVREQDLRAERDRKGDRHPLQLAAGELEGYRRIRSGDSSTRAWPRQPGRVPATWSRRAVAAPWSRSSRPGTPG